MDTKILRARMLPKLPELPKPPHEWPSNWQKTLSNAPNKNVKASFGGHFKHLLLTTPARVALIS